MQVNLIVKDAQMVRDNLESLREKSKIVWLCNVRYILINTLLLFLTPAIFSTGT